MHTARTTAHPLLSNKDAVGQDPLVPKRGEGSVCANYVSKPSQLTVKELLAGVQIPPLHCFKGQIRNTYIYNTHKHNIYIISTFGKKNLTRIQ